MFKDFSPVAASITTAIQQEFKFDYRTAEEYYQACIDIHSKQDIEKGRKWIKEALEQELYGYLQKAAELESVLCFQYLYAAFSMKKYPEELTNSDENTRNRQLEMVRRWEARILYVARQEMEHLNLVQNLLVFLQREPYLQRPNFPVSSSENPLGYPINLMRFDKRAVETFRFWEKPDELKLPFPDGGISKIDPFDQDKVTIESWDRLHYLCEECSKSEKGMTHVGNSGQLTIEELYTRIDVFFYFLLEQEILESKDININRIVEEHFGFNISLEPIVKGKYFQYVHDVISQILDEGEGAWGVAPALGSHFMVYQDILNEYEEELGKDSSFEPGLPGVENPTYNPNNPGTVVTNKIGAFAMELFNQAYGILDYMLYGFFNSYAIDYTTGIRPPVPNSFFRTSFYPFMTMVIRPLGEMVSRLPAFEGENCVGGNVPKNTAGPNFYYDTSRTGWPIKYRKLHKLMTNKKPVEKGNKFHTEIGSDMKVAFSELSKNTAELKQMIVSAGYEMANYQHPDARSFGTRLEYLKENIDRISINFNAYWDGEIIAPIPSENFQNFSNQYN